MLSEKQFRERAKVELRQIGKQVTSLATDRDIYWKLERDVIARNPALQSPNPFIDMVRGAYADAMATRILRLLDSQVSGPSLLRVLQQIGDYPQLLHDKVSEREFADDRASLQQAADDCEREPWTRILLTTSVRRQRWRPPIARSMRPSMP